MQQAVTIPAATQTLHFDKAEDALTFQALLKTSKLPIFVDFFAVWCGPCKIAAPIVEKFGTEYAGKAYVIKLDTDELNELAVEYGVQSIPTVIIFKDGKEVSREIGFSGEGRYRQMLDKVLTVTE